MTILEYLDRLLVHYASTFDIYKSYEINSRKYPAYGYFFSHVEKYVLMREANLWKADSYEHILFIDCKEICEEDILHAKTIIKEYIEPLLVRKGNRYPDENHMYSYITVVLLSDLPIEKRITKLIKGFRYEKGYKFNIRGYSQGRCIAVDLASEKIYFNYAARDLKKIYKQVFAEVESGKTGFEYMMEKLKTEAPAEENQYGSIE